MTAEQLEELELIAEGHMPDAPEFVMELALRVLAAEKLVEALALMRDTTNRAGMYDLADEAITAYREASK